MINEVVAFGLTGAELLVIFAVFWMFVFVAGLIITSILRFLEPKKQSSNLPPEISDEMKRLLGNLGRSGR